MTVWYTALVVAGAAPCSGWPWRYFQPRGFACAKPALAGDRFSRRRLFAGVRLEIHVQQRLRHLNSPGVISASLWQAPLWGSDNQAQQLCAGGVVRYLALLRVRLIPFPGDLQTIDKSLYEAAETDGANPSAAVSHRHAVRDYAGPGDGGDPAHYLDVLHVRRMFIC